MQMIQRSKIALSSSQRLVSTSGLLNAMPSMEGESCATELYLKHSRSTLLSLYGPRKAKDGRPMAKESERQKGLTSPARHWTKLQAVCQVTPREDGAQLVVMGGGCWRHVEKSTESTFICVRLVLCLDFFFLQHFCWDWPRQGGLCFHDYLLVNCREYTPIPR